jgi:hypothetical protein
MYTHRRIGGIDIIIIVDKKEIIEKVKESI